MLSKSPADRPLIAEILKLPFLKPIVAECASGCSMLYLWRADVQRILCSCINAGVCPAALFFFSFFLASCSARARAAAALAAEDLERDAAVAVSYFFA